jgi:hypothetical protein
MGVVVAVAFQWQSSISLQRRTARADFATHAAEIVMNNASPIEAAGRAKALVALFPKELDAGFAATFDPNGFYDRVEYERQQEAAAKMALLALIAAHPDQRNELIVLWRQMFPADHWIDDITG